MIGYLPSTERIYMPQRFGIFLLQFPAPHPAALFSTQPYLLQEEPLPQDEPLSALVKPPQLIRWEHLWLCLRDTGSVGF